MRAPAPARKPGRAALVRAKRASPRVEPARIFRSSLIGRGGSARARHCRAQRQHGNPRTRTPEIAEAQIDLRRVRHARHQILSHALSDSHSDPQANMGEKVRILDSLSRPNAPEMPIEATPEGPQKIATILSQKAKQLRAMDQYERRALSRRKFSIRAFDDARRRQVDFNHKLINKL
jgi:hypothetical protein